MSCVQQQEGTAYSRIFYVKQTFNVRHWVNKFLCRPTTKKSTRFKKFWSTKRLICPFVTDKNFHLFAKKEVNVLKRVDSTNCNLEKEHLSEIYLGPGWQKFRQSLYYSNILLKLNKTVSSSFVNSTLLVNNQCRNSHWLSFITNSIYLWRTNKQTAGER